MDIPILHHAGPWIVVAKPSGLSVHNAEDGNSLREVLKEKTGESWNPVHRIDKQTSGVLVLSRTQSSSRLLQAALESSTKIYAAVVRGHVGTVSGDWKQPLTNKAEGARNPQGKSAQRVHAHTAYVRCDSNRYLSAVRLQLRTGRQHQIRKHAVLNRHAVLGDPRYGDRRYNAMINKRYGFSGMTLHAESLQLTVSGRDFSWVVPIPRAWSCFDLNFNQP